MTLRRITVQELADACGLSRNTVSKVLNGRGSVPEATRQAVLNKAREIGFLQPAAIPTLKNAPERPVIAMLTSNMPEDSHFGTLFIPAFTGFVSRAGYTLVMYELTEEELREKKLPGSVSLDKTAAFLAIELFNEEYLEMLGAIGLPMLLVDGCGGANSRLMKSDRIMMENSASAAILTKHLIDRGAKRFGFVGDSGHCCSFQERYEAFEYTLWHDGIRLDPAMSICETDDAAYHDAGWVRSRLEAMPELPDAFFCANDYLAIQVMTALKQMGVAIPQRVMVAGFDGTPQSGVVEPALTTALIPVTKMSRVAATMLMSRIQNPDREFCCTYVKTTPVFRASTAKNPDAAGEKKRT